MLTTTTTTQKQTAITVSYATKKNKATMTNERRKRTTTKSTTTILQTGLILGIQLEKHDYKLQLLTPRKVKKNKNKYQQLFGPLYLGKRVAVAVP